MDKRNPVRVGLVGCGNICGIYLKNAAILPHVQIIAVADVDQARAKATAEQYGPKVAGRALSVEGLLGDGEVECVLNLTPPGAHASVGMAALAAGKHLYNEKPLAIELNECGALMETAGKKGLKVGCAPDTFMGAGLQTCRDAIERGLIGRPVGGLGYMMYCGPDTWHPSPEFFFKKGAGPLFDMGPYYLTALASMIGPVAKVGGMAKVTRAKRTITSEPMRGKVIEVETPTHVAGVLELEGGALVNLTMSFDVQHHTMPPLEVFGEEATLRVPDPNGFGGPVLIKAKGDTEWRELPLVSVFHQNWRGIGLNEMARAIRGQAGGGAGGGFGANGLLAQHVTAAMHGILAAAREGRVLEVGVKAPRPSAWKADEATVGAVKLRTHE